MTIVGIREDQAVLSDLIERVEAGEGEDREIDVALSRLYFGVPEDRTPLAWLHCYTSSLDAVLELIRAKLPEWHWSVSQQVGGFFRGNLWDHASKFEVYKLAPTPPRALLAAALRAIQTVGTLADANPETPL
jgi:hypothetical protein